ncbi:hypothetical protein BDP27DRAFT_430988 [Rhodocollybia butyracea]|uniref:PPM-type phosphatase domain-containing protein n=1 Tax=Rhodocollybia butyracea TaxID=206335 RepID=A0A9P5PBF1_9AGAR|nr:hypothetical protein BDP27DRAFT_430988 [Rhodocollybia butyracea]
MPSEDSITVYFPDNPDHKDDRCSYIALLDGHNGPAMSDFLCDHIVQYIVYTLSQLPQQYEPTGFFFDHDDAHTPATRFSSLPSAPIPDQTFVNDTIKQAFRRPQRPLLPFHFQNNTVPFYCRVVLVFQCECTLLDQIIFLSRPAVGGSKFSFTDLMVWYVVVV